MKLIKRLSKFINEELHDAMRYAKCAIEQKDERPELARTFLQLANAEMEHMQLLHQSVTALIDEERRTNGEPPPGMVEAYDMIHEWQMEEAAEVRSLIQMARE